MEIDITFHDTMIDLNNGNNFVMSATYFKRRGGRDMSNYTSYHENESLNYLIIQVSSLLFYN